MTSRTTQDPVALATAGPRPGQAGSHLPPAPASGLPAPAMIPLLIVGFVATYLFSSTTIALPTVVTDLRADHAGGALVLGGYSATFATLLVLFGRLGDRIGRRTVMTAGLTLLAVAGAAAGLAPTLPALIGARVVLGVGAALAIPQVLSTIQATSTGAARLRGIALFSAASGLGTAAGQVIGGVLLSANLGGLSWRPVMWFGAALCVIAAVVSPLVPQTRGAHTRLDLLGAMLFTLGLLGVLIPLDLGPAQGWPWWAIVTIAAAVAVLGLFWHRQRRLEAGHRTPLISPSVVQIPSVAIGLVMALVFFSTFGTFMVVIAHVAQSDRGMAPVATGVMLMPFVLAFVAASLLITRIASRLGTLTMPLGAACQATGIVLVAVGHVLGSVGGGWALAIQPGLLLIGVAQAVMFGPMVQTIMAGVPDSVAGLTGGLVNTVQQGGFALGVAVLGGGYFAVEAAWGPIPALPALLGIQLLAAAVYAGCAWHLRSLTRDRTE